MSFENLPMFETAMTKTGFALLITVYVSTVLWLAGVLTSRYMNIMVKVGDGGGILFVVI